MGKQIRKAQRRTYKLSRFLGDVQAASKGRYVQRRVKRVVHRREIGVLRRLGLW